MIVSELVGLQLRLGEWVLYLTQLGIIAVHLRGLRTTPLDFPGVGESTGKRLEAASHCHTHEELGSSGGRSETAKPSRLHMARGRG